MNILLTGGRAPATLDLARAFHRAGHKVYVAESLRHHLCRSSRAVTRNFAIPAARQRTEDFIRAIAEIVKAEHIDVLIPTCEEVFYVARGREQIPCRVFVEPIERLDILHNKLKFSRQAAAYGLRVPDTRLPSGEGDLAEAFAELPDLVLKPVYSRFASHTLVKPSLERAQVALRAASSRAWVAQPFLPGRQICTYSICHDGRVTAHTAYATDFTAGQGATILFRHLEQAATMSWVERFVECFEFTGQIAFDFIEGADGTVYALECNPRATSGVHLLADSPEFVAAFLNPDAPLVTPPAGAPAKQLAAAMLVYGLPASLRSRRFATWLAAFGSSRDVVFDRRDPLPAVLQLRSILEYLALARAKGITALQASTYDIEWNGERG
ncbi:MAG: ATP-grasp domain-containing protein [Anaerolineae bacterium]